MACTLPLVPSELLRLAARDLKAAFSRPDTEINMGLWHEPARMPHRNMCTVCLAGAVMIGALGNYPDIDKTQPLMPAYFDDDATLLHALNMARLGIWDRFEAYVDLARKQAGLPPLLTDVPEKLNAKSREYQDEQSIDDVQELLGEIEVWARTWEAAGF